MFMRYFLIWKSASYQNSKKLAFGGADNSEIQNPAHSLQKSHKETPANGSAAQTNSTETRLPLSKSIDSTECRSRRKTSQASSFPRIWKTVRPLNRKRQEATRRLQIR